VRTALSTDPSLLGRRLDLTFPAVDRGQVAVSEVDLATRDDEVEVVEIEAGAGCVDEVTRGAAIGT